VTKEYRAALLLPRNSQQNVFLAWKSSTAAISDLKDILIISSKSSNVEENLSAHSSIDFLTQFLISSIRRRENTMASRIPSIASVLHWWARSTFSCKAGSTGSGVFSLPFGPFPLGGGALPFGDGGVGG
jgi:hypothetical protein